MTKSISTNWKIGDRVARTSKPLESGTVVVQQYTAWDGSGEYVKVLWDASRSKSVIRADRVKKSEVRP